MRDTRRRLLDAFISRARTKEDWDFIEAVTALYYENIQLKSNIKVLERRSESLTRLMEEIVDG